MKGLTKVAALFLVLTLALAGVGVGFAHWSDTVTIDGTVTSETEVLINGRVAKLEDLIIGERIKVEGYQMGKGENKRLVATRVTVERSEVIDTSKSSEKGEGS